jgi:hypothetical protein
MPIPELNLSLGLTDNDSSVFYAGSDEGEIIVRTDSALKQHTISITISEQQAGSVNLKTHLNKAGIPAEIEIPTYQMIVTDDKTNDKEVYKATRELIFLKNKRQGKVY